MTFLTRQHPDIALTDKQITALTRIVFLDPVEPVPCDLIYIFGGTHPGGWEAGAEAYHRGWGAQILVTGCIPQAPKFPHASWIGEERLLPNCRRIAINLFRLGVPEEIITCDEHPSHTLEEALSVRAFVDAHLSIASVLCISKSFAMGRQYRTLQKALPDHFTLIPYPFDTNLSEGESVTRDNWMDIPLAKAMVLAEYNRILRFGASGHLTPLDAPVPGLENVELPW